MQTFHPSHRNFWAGEVFKTGELSNGLELFLNPLTLQGHFADHPLPDLIEKIACQFTARHIRGRPRPPYWYPGWPLYVCDSRYNDRERNFVKIKNWNSCVPEEVRKSTEFMPIYPFERTVFPRRKDSPFLERGGVKGPGGIDESVDRIAVDSEGGREKDKGEATMSTRKKQKRNADHTGPNKGVYVGAHGGTGAVAGTTSSSQYPYQPAYPSQQTQPHHHRSGSNSEDRSIITAVGGLANLGSNIKVERLGPEISKSNLRISLTLL
jgi:chromatin structure-remodeling complex subunit RSC1/2